MKTKAVVVAGLVAIVTLAVWARQGGRVENSTAERSAVQVEWLTDFVAAQQKAQAENKPLLVDFTGSDWCPPCIMLEKQVFSRSEFADYAAQKLILVKIDFPRRKRLPEAQQAANHALARRFGIIGYPTVLVLNPEGEVKGTLGYMFGPEKFIAGIEEALARG